MPLMMPGIVVRAFILAFIISLDDFIITNFVKGAGVETLPTAIFGAVKQGIKPNIMAISDPAFAGHVDPRWWPLSWLIGTQRLRKPDPTEEHLMKHLTKLTDNRRSAWS